jgi:hypothetical protein
MLFALEQDREINYVSGLPTSEEGIPSEGSV